MGDITFDISKLYLVIYITSLDSSSTFYSIGSCESRRERICSLTSPSMWDVSANLVRYLKIRWNVGINLFLLGLHIFNRRPIQYLCFLSCRPFFVNTIFSTGLVGCWMGLRWKIDNKNKLILIEIFPSVHETWYLKV